MKKSPDRLTICYNAWLIFNENDDYDDLIRQTAERGFNCVRIEDGAGLLWDADGNARTDVLIRSPFGKFSRFTAYRVIPDSIRIHPLERLLRICRAAKKYDVKLVLSSWFFLHTNWFCEEKDAAPLFAMSTEEKIRFFAEELNRILELLKREGLIDVVAFAEIFNEFDGLPFAGEYRGLAPEWARELRILHEAEIDRLKKRHPDVLFAFDTYKAEVEPELIPRNIDVLNFHCYYLWPIYHEFERGIVQRSLEEPEIPPETAYFLKDKIITVREVAEEMGEIRTGQDYPRRMSLYASIDEAKMAELTDFLDRKLGESMDRYRRVFREKIDIILETHARIVPDSAIVMGEGMTYCASPELTFERDSENFWQLAREQMAYLREKGLWGTVVTTTHAPGRAIAWEACTDRYVEANNIFLNGPEA